MLAGYMLCVDLRYCAMCACGTVLCVHALLINGMYMYPIPKHARRAQSRRQRSRVLSNCAS